MSQRLVGKNKSRKAKSLYAIQENQLVIQQDIPKLPVPIQKLYPCLKQLLSTNPVQTNQYFPNALELCNLARDEQESQRADKERLRAERLAEKL